jgi:integrase
MSVYISLNYTSKKENYSREDTIPVVVYYYFSGKKIKISTGILVKLKDWDFEWEKKHSKNPVKNSDEEHIEKNLILKQKLKEVQDIIHKINLNYEIPTVDLVRSYLKLNVKKREKKTIKNMDFLFVLDTFRKYVIEKSILRSGYKRTVKSNLKKIEEFVIQYNSKNKYQLSINGIDDDFQWEFLDFLNSKGEQPTTIKKRFIVLGSLFNWSKKNNYTDLNFKSISFNHDNEKDVIFLTREEVLKLYNFTDFNYSSPNHKNYTSHYITDKLKNGKTITYTNYEVYRDMIVFGCGLGCRYGDLVKLKIDNYQFGENRSAGFFTFRMEKSRVAKQVKVPINKLTFEIWKKYSKNKSREDYIFPRTSTGRSIYNEKVNKNIKIIGEIVGLDRLVSKPRFTIEGQIIEGSDIRKPLHEFLSTHIMRRTFIREGLENKVPTHVLMSMSGHTTEKVFRRYFSTTVKELGEEGGKLFSFDLSDDTDKEKGLNGGVKEKNVEVATDNKIEKLKELKSLFENGLIPQEVYFEKVRELI